MRNGTPVRAAIAGIAYYLPEHQLTTSDLAQQYPGWSVEKIDNKTGIKVRHIAGPEECASDLAFEAATRLFASGCCRPEDIDFVLLCTQSPDYFLPTTACLLQNRLGIPKTSGALDFNLGCSGFVYGLGMAQGLIETGQARNVLLLTAETYSKFIHPLDRSVRTIFGDAAAATLITGVDRAAPFVGPFVYGTDGSGGKALIVPSGGCRVPRSETTAVAAEDESGNVRSADNLFMNGSDVFTFTLDVVPAAVKEVLAKAQTTLDQIDLIVFHQANKYMLDHLRKRMALPVEKFWVSMEHCGNTVSSTIPIALKDAQAQGRLAPGARVLLVGFGVGLSWAATIVEWTGE